MKVLKGGLDGAALLVQLRGWAEAEGFSQIGVADVDLGSAEAGLYAYAGGFNTIAIVAMLAGILPNAPGFLATVKLVSQDLFPGWLTQLYHYAWFVVLCRVGYSLLYRNETNKTGWINSCKPP